MPAELARDWPVVLGCGAAHLSCADFSHHKEAAVQLPVGPNSSA